MAPAVKRKVVKMIRTAEVKLMEAGLRRREGVLCIIL